MTVSTDLLNRWKEYKQIESDYAAAKALEVTRSAISRWRTGDGQMSLTTALQIAEDLGLDPMPVIAQIQAETLEPRPEAARWRRYCARAGVAPLVALAFAATLGQSPTSSANEAHRLTEVVNQAIHYAH